MEYRVVIFDLDGTLVDGTESIWITLHTHFGIENHPERLKAKEMFEKGKITYQEWAERDIELMKRYGANKEELMKAISNLRLMKGAIETLNELKKRGYRLAVISGSLNIVLEKLIPDYDGIFDYVFINRIYFDEKGKIKSLEPTKFDIMKKVGALKLICEKENITPEKCVFVGDHDNDVHIAKVCGLSIAFNASSARLESVCNLVVKEKNIRKILKYI